MVLFNFYPVTTVMVILLALLNDLPIITIAYDNTWLPPKPVRWEMRRILTIATVLGLIGVVETFGLLLIGRLWLKLDEGPLQSFIYLKLAVAGHLTLLVVRNKRPFFSKPYPAPILLVAILATQAVAVLIVGLGVPSFGIVKISWPYVGLAWGYCLAWMFIEDWAKLADYHHLHLTGKHHRKFINRLQGPLTS
jgi:H+-transporting ATPase